MASSLDAPPASPAGISQPPSAVAPAAPVSARSPSTRVPDKPTRRRFSIEDKLRVIQAFQACSTPEQRGQLARKESLYYGQITDWVEAHRRGGAAALGPKRSGPVPSPDLVPLARLTDAEREVARWKARAERAEALCEVQKKLSLLLGLLSDPTYDKP